MVRCSRSDPLKLCPRRETDRRRPRPHSAGHEKSESHLGVPKMVARKFPQWLRRPFPAGSVYQTQGVVDGFRLHTVCESALCPNRPECFSERTAAFMILG